MNKLLNEEVKDILNHMYRCNDSEKRDAEIEFFFYCLNKACSNGLNEPVETLLLILDTITQEPFRSRMIYTCMTIANKLNCTGVIDTLMNLEVWRPMDGDLKGDGSSKSRLLLHCATSNNDITIAKKLVEFGINVNAPNRFGETPLHLTCEPEFADYLLLNGANPSSVTKRNETPLYYACSNRRLGVIRKLLDEGAQPSTGKSFLPIDMNCDWASVSRIAEVLFECQVSTNDHIDYQSCSSKLHNLDDDISLCRNCKAECFFDTFLDKLMHHQYINLQMLVISVYQNKISTGDENVTTLENFLANCSSNEMDAVDMSGASALYVAVECKLFNVAKILLEYGANPDNVYADKHPLVTACRYVPDEFTSLLLSWGADTGVVDRYGKSPLTIAADSLDLPLVVLLLAHGADVTRCDREGRTALHIVLGESKRPCVYSKLGNTDIVEALFNSVSFDTTEQYIEFQKSVLECSLDYCLQARSFKSDRRLSVIGNELLAFESLLESGIDSSLLDLEQVVLARGYHILNSVMRYHGNPNWCNATGNSLVNISCGRFDIRGIRILIDAGADTNAIDINSLVNIVRGNKVEIFRLMLNSGLKISGQRFDLSIVDDYELHDFFIKFCSENECLIQLLKAGLNIKLLGKCVEPRRQIVTCTDSCLNAGNICRTLVLGGYKVQGEQFLDQLKSNKARHAQQLAEWLETDLSTPQTLHRLARSVIRQQLSTASGYCSIISLVNDLPLPKALQKYIIFEGPLAEVHIDAETCETCEQEIFDSEEESSEDIF